MTIDVALENQAEEDLAIDILRECHLLVHPGYFYDITGNHLVMSFLQDRETLRGALSLLREFLDEREQLADNKP